MKGNNRNQKSNRKENIIVKESTGYIRVDVDGRYYVFTPEVGEPTEFKIGVDISQEIVDCLVNGAHDTQLNDRYAEEAEDPLFEAKVKTYVSQEGNEDGIDPMDSIPDYRYSPETVLFPDENLEKEDIEGEVDAFIEEDCSEEQQDIFYGYYGEEKTFVELRQEEAEKSGKDIGESGMSMRNKRLLDKGRKALDDIPDKLIRMRNGKTPE